MHDVIKGDRKIEEIDMWHAHDADDDSNPIYLIYLSLYHIIPNTPATYQPIYDDVMQSRGFYNVKLQCTNSISMLRHPQPLAAVLLVMML